MLRTTLLGQDFLWRVGPASNLLWNQRNGDLRESVSKGPRELLVLLKLVRRNSTKSQDKQGESFRRLGQSGNKWEGQRFLNFISNIKTNDHPSLKYKLPWLI
jgi:hypothetical protein